VGAIKENSKDKKGEMVVVGNRTRVKVVKNKMAPPFREAEFDILYGKGVSRSGEVVDMAVELNFIQKSGAWYSVGSERIGQGRDNARAYLEEHPDTMTKLEAQILTHFEIGKTDASKSEAIKSEGGKSDGAKSDGAKADGGKGGEGSSASATVPSGARATSASRAESIDDDDDSSAKAKTSKPDAAKAANGTARPTTMPAKRPGARAN
jgi:recombination protein RecA